MAALTEERVRALIGEAIGTAVGNGGAIHTAASNLIEEQSRPEGSIYKAFSGAFDAKADAEFPFRAVLRGLSAAQWRAAWEAIKADPDHVSSVMDSLPSPGSGMSQFLALHAAMKSAPKKSWKQLCLPQFGGGADTLQVFLSERAETSTDDNVKALSRAVLALYQLVEKRFTTMQHIEKSSPGKVEGQKIALMPFVYQSIKAFKHRTVKPSACVQLHTDILMKDFGQDLLLGLVVLREGTSGNGAAAAKPGATVDPSGQKRSQQPFQQGPPEKNPRVFGPGGASAAEAEWEAEADVTDTGAVAELEDQVDCLVTGEEVSDAGQKAAEDTAYVAPQA